MIRWVEHDPREILETVKVCIATAVEKATADGHDVKNGLKAIGLTNQRETTLVWSKSTGAPLHNALVWMDVRTSSICRSSLFFLFRSFPTHQVRHLFFSTITIPFPKLRDCKDLPKKLNETDVIWNLDLYFCMPFLYIVIPLDFRCFFLNKNSQNCVNTRHLGI